MKQSSSHHHNYEGIFHPIGQGNVEPRTRHEKMSDETHKRKPERKEQRKNCGNISQNEKIPKGKMSKADKTCKIPSQSSTLSENSQTQIP